MGNGRKLLTGIDRSVHSLQLSLYFLLPMPPLNLRFRFCSVTPRGKSAQSTASKKVETCPKIWKRVDQNHG